MRVAAFRMMLSRAAAVQSLVDELGLRLKPEADVTSLYDNLITDETLREATRQVFLDGHFALAVEEAYKCLNNVVKHKSGFTTDGAKLMNAVFSPEKPRLKINELKTQSQKDQQQGYMQILAGCMVGIRNPRAHEHRYMDEPFIALEMLVWANHLIRIVKTSKRTRRK
ncbi:Conserved hypothetical protein CHP02391 [Moorella glycerini]|uniref:Conserved hypothetical protein CHP02391 domain-containing protein n=1 Tax=Neomoorella stamsii TaxID=1266720 RepID=A0A9X7P6R8_9FIRM|nr:MULTISPECIES: TIGR02391 family protein [Moorella]PRR74604.1 hypothetical protein MOST_10390 [Moorella stamsii]CEP69109.1 Conserved hypothetical protein CHP02391 [Moorella glycerini]